jgi:hypothetical protein
MYGWLVHMAGITQNLAELYTGFFLQATHQTVVLFRLTMIDKFLKFAVAALLACSFAQAAASSPYSHEWLGRCYPSQAQVQALFQPPNGAVDENIVSVTAPFSKNAYWVIDKTSSHNYQWHLFEESTKGLCFTLYVPFAADVVGVRQKGVLTIEAKTQPSPGTASYTMTFRKSSRTGRFVPYKCTATRDAHAAKSVTKTIDCLKVGQ